MGWDSFEKKNLNNNREEKTVVCINQTNYNLFLFSVPAVFVFFAKQIYVALYINN